jgi:hypothetical protein
MKSQASPDAVCEEQVLRMRIESVAQAQKRSRAAFLASTVVSIAIVITIWNAYGSWYRNFLFTPAFAENRVTEQAQKSLIDEWVRSSKVSIPLLGIQVRIGDGAVLGSLSLYVICIWLFLSMRRENHTIGLLLRDTQACKPAVRNMVYQGIVSFAIFTTVTDIDAPIDNLDERRTPIEPKTFPLIRFTYRFLILLPALTIACMFVTDFVSIIFFKSPFREPHEPLWKKIGFGEWIQRGAMETLCISLFFLTLFVCVRIVKFNSGTEKVLREYEKLTVETSK